MIISLKVGGGVFSGTEYSQTVDNYALNIYGGKGYGHGALLQLTGKDDIGNGEFNIQAHNGATYTVLKGKANGVLRWGSKNLAMQEDFVPRSGGCVLTDSLFAVGTEIECSFGFVWGSGSRISSFGATSSSYTGVLRLQPQTSTTTFKTMQLEPNGTWVWTGTAVQLQSDQRLKQQITQIDNALLDAWEDVEPVQFKYNDAVDQKGDNARLHTGYVVQQIDDACKSHNIDISEYGLYCHEDYPERTEEVTIENEDGTTTKETKVIEPAREYYSLRYTETLVVECAYLRRENAKLKEQLQNHEDYLKLVEEHLHLKNL